jgi:hypothetical protein
MKDLKTVIYHITTVKDLIKNLEKIDKNAIVLIGDYEFGPDIIIGEPTESIEFFDSRGNFIDTSWGNKEIENSRKASCVILK